MNVVEPIFFQARNKPSAVALIAPGTPVNLVSYARLVAMVSNACRRLELSNIRAGDSVALEVSDSLLRAIFIIALARLGVIILSAANGEHAWPLEVSAVVSNLSNKTFAARHLPVDYEWVMEARRQPDEKDYGVQSSNVCCIFAESVEGATKYFALTHELLNARIGRQDVFFGAAVSAAPRLFNADGCGTSLGIQLLFSMLSRGAALLLMGDQTLSFNALDTYQIESAVLTPQKLLDLAAFYETRVGSECGLKDIFVAGHVPKSAIERTSRTLQAKISLGYYLTQPGMIASMPFRYSKLENAVGVLLPGVAVDILANDGLQLGAGRIGELRLRSEVSADIYGGAQESDARHTWCETGQKGYLTEDQILILQS
jgi:acyl-coenzyme A synthetase/AMP-(fatty) acid ligase